MFSALIHTIPMEQSDIQRPMRNRIHKWHSPIKTSERFHHRKPPSADLSLFNGSVGVQGLDLLPAHEGVWGIHPTQEIPGMAAVLLPSSAVRTPTELLYQSHLVLRHER